jgi:hypothetical protein
VTFDDRQNLAGDGDARRWDDESENYKEHSGFRQDITRCSRPLRRIVACAVFRSEAMVCDFEVGDPSRRLFRRQRCWSRGYPCNSGDSGR